MPFEQKRWTALAVAVSKSGGLSRVGEGRAVSCTSHGVAVLVLCVDVPMFS